MKIPGSCSTLHLSLLHFVVQGEHHTASKCVAFCGSKSSSKRLHYSKSNFVMPGARIIRWAQVSFFLQGKEYQLHQLQGWKNIQKYKNGCFLWCKEYAKHLIMLQFTVSGGYSNHIDLDFFILQKEQHQIFVFLKNGSLFVEFTFLRSSQMIFDITYVYYVY